MTNRFYGALYTGVTSDLLARVVEHRDGAFDGFTKRYDIKRLVWFEGAPSMEAAIAHEKRVKKWLRDWKIALIERDNPRWEDLGPSLGLPPLRDWTRAVTHSVGRNRRRERPDGPRLKAGVTD